MGEPPRAAETWCRSWPGSAPTPPASPQRRAARSPGGTFSPASPVCSWLTVQVRRLWALGGGVPSPSLCWGPAGSVQAGEVCLDTGDPGSLPACLFLTLALPTSGPERHPAVRPPWAPLGSWEPGAQACQPRGESGENRGRIGAAGSCPQGVVLSPSRGRLCGWVTGLVPVSPACLSLRPGTDWSAGSCPCGRPRPSQRCVHRGLGVQGASPAPGRPWVSRRH